jgi:hypothetical protein
MAIRMTSRIATTMAAIFRIFFMIFLPPDEAGKWRSQFAENLRTLPSVSLRLLHSSREGLRGPDGFVRGRSVCFKHRNVMPALDSVIYSLL